MEKSAIRRAIQETGNEGRRKTVQETGNQGVKESQMILKLLQEMAEGEAVKRGNIAAAMEADESGMSNRDMDLINMALGRGVTKSVRPQARNILKKAKGGAIRAYNNGGAVMAGRGPKYKGMR